MYKNYLYYEISIASELEALEREKPIKIIFFGYFSSWLQGVPEL